MPFSYLGKFSVSKTVGISSVAISSRLTFFFPQMTGLI